MRGILASEVHDPWKKSLPLAAIVAVGAFARLFRLDAGLPEIVHVDSFRFVGEAARMVTSGEIGPERFHYPGLVINLLALVYWVGGVEGGYWQHLWAQGIAAVSGTGLIAGTYLLARRLCGRAWSLLAAGLCAVCIQSVTLSRIPSPDNLGTLFMTLVLWAMLAPRLRWVHYLLAGLFGGLAVGCKFNGVYVLPFIALASWIGPGRDRWQAASTRQAVALGLAIGAFTLTTPFFWSHVGDYAAGLRLQSAIQASGQIGRTQGGLLDYLISATPTWEQPWLSTSVLHNLGPPGLLVLLAAAAAAISWRAGRAPFLCGLYLVAYTVAITGVGHVKAYRYLMPVLPVAYVLIAWALGRAWLRWGRSRGRFWLATVTVVALLAWPVWRTGRFVVASARPLSNQLAAAWMSANLPAGSRVLLSPLFVEDLLRLDFEFFSIANAGPRQYRLPEGVGASGERDPVYRPEMVAELRRNGVRFIVLNSYFDGAFAPIPENRRFFPRSVGAFREFGAALKREATPVFSVEGHSAGRLGPDITIYEIGRVAK